MNQFSLQAGDIFSNAVVNRAGMTMMFFSQLLDYRSIGEKPLNWLRS
jgi:hypothetical protein